ncbi:MAG: hypothetical protein ABID45_01890 [Patescibacteria group bacterium]
MPGPLPKEPQPKEGFRTPSLKKDRRTERWPNKPTTIIEEPEPQSPRSPKSEERDPKKNPDDLKYGFDREASEGKNREEEKED